jgi:MORN repeat
MIQHSIENLPKPIQKAVLKARAAAALVPQSVAFALEAEQKAKAAMQRAIAGEQGYRVSDWGDGYTYLGEWGKNTPNGFGVLDTNGKAGFYYGQWRHGYWQGHGVYLHKADQLSLKYTGTVWRDLRHGNGIYEWKQGNKWIGEMKQDSIRGYGIFEWANGNIFEGYKGTMDKRVYYSNDRDRFGAEWQANGDAPKIGRWENGVFVQLV